LVSTRSGIDSATSATASPPPDWWNEASTSEIIEVSHGCKSRIESGVNARVSNDR
jgi:hypothetical protein